MSNTQVVTLRMSKDLKRRLEQEARYQGISLNQLANYIINNRLTEMEMISALETRLAQKSISDLKERVGQILDKVPGREVANWDRKS